MGSTNIQPARMIEQKNTEMHQITVRPVYEFSELQRFNPDLLNIGDIEKPSGQINAIAAMFDLSHFTDFCNQVDPHLSIPEFLSKFLIWLFEGIKSNLMAETLNGERLLYSELPFFSKFTGDGVLFLWDTDGLDINTIDIIVSGLNNICSSYKSDFLKQANKIFSNVPPTLRCGVARGMVCSVGNGHDFVGPCINIASRLQKMSSLTFTFSRRGIDFATGMDEKTASLFITKAVSIRGIGDDEKVCIKKDEFDKLAKKEKQLFQDV